MTSSGDPDTHRTSGSPPVVYEIDHQHSRVAFRAKAFGLLWVRGHLPVVAGELRIVDDTLQGGGEFDAAGVDTGLRSRDWHLRTGHYLSAGTHPRIRVTLPSCAISGSTVTCSVTVRGRTEPATIDVDRLEQGPEQIHVSAHGTMDRTVFPMLPPIAGVSRHVGLRIDLLGRRRPDIHGG